MIQPTVGRMVNVWPGRSWPGVHSHHTLTQPFAGIIAHVWSDTMINIGYFDANGMHYSKTSVTLVQPEDADQPRPEHGYCEWMDYQVGQAAKADAMRHELDAYRANFGPLPAPSDSPMKASSEYAQEEVGMSAGTIADLNSTQETYDGPQTGLAEGGEPVDANEDTAQTRQPLQPGDKGYIAGLGEQSLT